MYRFVALGSVWLDEIRKEGEEPLLDIPGGSVTFATLGARFFASEDTKLIGLIFNAGADFPDAIIEIFRSWGVDLEVRRKEERAARGIVFYEKANGNRKGFQRLTPPLPVGLQDLRGTSLLASRVFHLFGTAADVEEQFGDSELIREINNQRRFVVWEPHAKSCLPWMRLEHEKAARLVDLFSPNHEELASFFDEASEAAFDTSVIEKQAKPFYEAVTVNGRDGCVVVRAAGHGCMVMSRKDGTVWLPSYHLNDSSKVVDPTGAGNAFLGAFAIGWQETGSHLEAAKYGQIAASFAIEQVGLPQKEGNGLDEKWNGDRVRRRLAEYIERVSQ